MKPLPQLSDYPIPETIELECKILSTMINDSTTIPQVIRVIKPEMFSRKENRNIWDTLMDMYNKREEISIVTVMQKVERKHFIDNILTAQASFGVMGIEGLMCAFVDTYVKRCAYIKSVEVLQKINSGTGCEEISDMFDKFKNDVMTGFRDETAKIGRASCRERV